MMNDLNERLARVTEQRARLEKLRRQAAELQAEHHQASIKATDLQRVLAREERDVALLEGLSLSGLVASFFGSKDEKLLKERQEAVAAQLKYDEARVRQQRLAAELDRVSLEVKGMTGVEADHQALLAEKERLIRQGEGSGELFALGEREQQTIWQIKELEEARRAGYAADDALSQVASSLESARNWGTWDMLGGGWIATAAKHSRIDEAKGELYHAQEALSRFQRELKDVQVGLHVPVVQMDGFTRFADYFFDGLFVDMAVQSQINESLRSIQHARGQVGGALSWVEQQLAGAQSELENRKQLTQQFVARYSGA